jgi:hypothetical protein
MPRLNRLLDFLAKTILPTSILAKMFGCYDTTAILMKTLLKMILLATLMNVTLDICFFTFTVVRKVSYK